MISFFFSSTCMIFFKYRGNIVLGGMSFFLEENMLTIRVALKKANIFTIQSCIHVHLFSRMPLWD